jgi:hypothetical protein
MLLLLRRPIFSAGTFPRQSPVDLTVAGVRFVPLVTPKAEHLKILPLAAAWLRGSRDPVRDEVLAVLRSRLPQYAAKA